MRRRILSYVLIGWLSVMVVTFAFVTQRFQSICSRRWATVGGGQSQMEQQTGSSFSSSSLKQVQIRYDCEEIDSDEISELLLEIGTLSVSCEVTSMKEGFLNEESNWHDSQSR